MDFTGQGRQAQHGVLQLTLTLNNLNIFATNTPSQCYREVDNVYFMVLGVVSFDAKRMFYSKSQRSVIYVACQETLRNVMFVRLVAHSTVASWDCQRMTINNNKH